MWRQLNIIRFGIIFAQFGHTIHKRLSQDFPWRASDRKFIFPYVVRIKIIVSMMKLLKLFRIFAFGLSTEATIERTWSSG